MKSFALLLIVCALAVAAHGEVLPDWFKVFSRDGRESFTVTCEPEVVNTSGVASEVMCTMRHVRFSPPELRPAMAMDIVPLTFEETLKMFDVTEEEAMKIDPIRLEELKTDFPKQLEATRAAYCEEYRARFERMVSDGVIGKKQRGHLERMLSSCEAGDSVSFFQEWNRFQERTCSLWVDEFELEFKRVKEGQWLYRQESPGRLSNVLKVYELTHAGAGSRWKLTETRIPTEGSEEEPHQTTWSWDYSEVYEIPCDFVKYDLVQVPSE